MEYMVPHSCEAFLLEITMIENYALLDRLNEILEPQKFKDYCPNGLQIEGQKDINKVITGVSLSEKLIDAAINRNAQAIIVHHGIFWNKDSYNITGIKKKRIEKLIKNNINLYAYHLPLDNHKELGNNIQLAKILGINPIGTTSEQELLWYGELITPITLKKFEHEITHKLLHKPQVFSNNSEQLIKKVAWCTGGADSFFMDAIELDVDVFISGEVSEPIYSLSEESDVVYIAAGHYATERYGIKSLSRYLTENNIVQAEFIELYNPI